MNDLQTSSCKKGTTDPVFDEDFVFYMTDNCKGHGIELKIFHKKNKSENILIGRVHLNLHDVEEEKPIQKTLVPFSELTNSLLAELDVDLLTDTLGEKGHELKKNLEKLDILNLKKKFKINELPTITVKVFSSTKSCEHTEHTSCQIMRGCCWKKGESTMDKYHGCEQCHSKVHKKRGRIEAIRCMFCLVEQPLRVYCISCERKMMPSCCEFCSMVHDVSEDGQQPRHCFDCKKCFDDPNHKHFIFTYERSNSRKQFCALQKIIRAPDEKHAGLFKAFPALLASLRWIEYFYTNEFLKSTITQIEQTLATIKRAEEPNKKKKETPEELKKREEVQKKLASFNDEVSSLTTLVLRLKVYLLEESKGNKTVRRRMVNLSKGRFVAKVKFLKMMKFDHVDGKDEEGVNEDEIDRDSEKYNVENVSSMTTALRDVKLRNFLGIKVSKLHGGETYNDVYEMIDNCVTFEELISGKMQTFMKKNLIPPSVMFEPPTNSFFLGHNNSIYQYLVGRMISLLYIDAKSLEAFSRESCNDEILKKERKFYQKYEKLFYADSLKSCFVENYVFMCNFQNNKLFLGVMLYKLGRLQDLCDEYAGKRVLFYHAIGMKELMDHALRHTQDVIVQCINTSFDNLELLFSIVNVLHECYNRLLIKSAPKHARNFVRTVTLRADYFDWLCVKLALEREVLYEGQLKHDDVQNFLILFQAVLEHLDKIKKDDVARKFRYYYKLDVVKLLAGDMKRRFAHEIVLCSKISRMRPEKIPVQFYATLFPLMYDLIKYIPNVTGGVDIYDRFQKSVYVSIRVHLAQTLEQWVHNASKADKFKPIDERLRHSHYLRNVVKFLFDPADIIYKLDIVSRESKVFKKSFFHDYFDVLITCFDAYATNCYSAIDMEVARVFEDMKMALPRSSSSKKNLVVDIFKALDPNDIQGEPPKVKEINMQMICTCVNNVHQLYRESLKVFSGSSFKLVFATSSLDIPRFEDEKNESEEEDEGEEEEVVYMDVPQIQDMLTQLIEKRDDCTKRVAHCMYLKLFTHIREMVSVANIKGKLKIKKDEEVSRWEMEGMALIARFVDDLDAGIGIVFSYIYTVVLKVVLAKLYDIIWRSFLDHFFTKDILKSKDKILVAVKKRTERLMQETVKVFAQGLKDDAIEYGKEKFAEAMDLLDLNKEALKKMAEKDDNDPDLEPYIVAILRCKHSVKSKASSLDKIARESESFRVAPSSSSSSKLSDTGTPITPVPSVFMSSSKKCIVYVTMLRGHKLPSMDSNGFSDPYVKCYIGKERRKTKVKKKTLNPRWNQKLTFKKCTNPRVEDLRIEVYDWDLVGSSDFMGECKVKLGDIVVGKRETMTLELQNKKMKGNVGKIDFTVEIVYKDKRK